MYPGWLNIYQRGYLHRDISMGNVMAISDDEKKEREMKQRKMRKPNISEPEITVEEIKEEREKKFNKENAATEANFKDRKSTRLNSSHSGESRMPSSA